MTVKKWIALAIALLLAFATVACTANDATSDTDPTLPPAEDTAEPEAQATDLPEATEAPVPQETEAPAETAAPEQPQSGDADVSGAVDASTTTETSAVPLGQWAKTARYATEDDTYHTVYVRLNKVTTASQDEAYVQSAIELHNSCSSDFRQIDVSTFNLPDDVELCVLDYEVFVPAEFPGPDYGIVEPSLDFSESNIGGGGIPAADGSSVYIGLGSNTQDLALAEDPTYQPGNTYAFRCLFTMVKGYTDYVFEITSYPDGTTETSVDVMYYAYFANK